jgi:uncharacterized cofD-like protein
VAGVAGSIGTVVPSTLTPVHLRATIGGEEVSGQVSIARGPGPVEELWLEPSDAPGLPAAIETLESADLVVLGPGSLFTSVIAAMLPKGIADAASRAGRIAFVMNLAEQNGETLGLDGVAHVEALRSHLPDLRLDAVLVHNASLFGIDRPVKIDEEALNAARAPVVSGDLRDDFRTDGPRHDPDKLAATLKSLLW